MGVVGLLPDPLVCPDEIAAETLVGAILEELHQSAPEFRRRVLRRLEVGKGSLSVRVERIPGVEGLQTGTPGRLHEPHEIPDDPGVPITPRLRNSVERRFGLVVIIGDRREEQTNVRMRHGRRLLRGRGVGCARERECEGGDRESLRHAGMTPSDPRRVPN